MASDTDFSGVEALATRVRQLLWVVLDSVPAELVEWSLMLVRLLHAADTFPRGGLYEGHYAAQAALRYEVFWLPLAARAAAVGRKSLLVPPMDVALAWLLHRCMAPLSYYEDCEALVDMPLEAPPAQAFRFAGSHAYSQGETPEQRQAWASREAWDAAFLYNNAGGGGVAALAAIAGGGSVSNTPRTARRAGSRNSSSAGGSSSGGGSKSPNSGSGGGAGSVSANATGSSNAGGGAAAFDPVHGQYWPPAPPGSRWDLTGRWPLPYPGPAPTADAAGVSGLRSSTDSGGGAAAMTSTGAASGGGAGAAVGAVRGRLAAWLAPRMSELCPLLHSLLRPAYLDPDVLAQAVQRYCRFLMLQSMYLNVPLVPTTDIALMWVAHMAVPASYRATCRRLLGGGRLLAPAPGALRLGDGGAAFAETRRLYEHHFGEVYDPPITRPVPLATMHPLLSTPLAPFLAAFDTGAPLAASTHMHQHEREPDAGLMEAGGEAGAAGSAVPAGYRCGAHALFLAFLMRRGSRKGAKGLLGMMLGQTHRRKAAIRYAASKAARFRDFLHLPHSDYHPYCQKLRLRRADPLAVSAALSTTATTTTSAAAAGQSSVGDSQMEEVSQVVSRQLNELYDSEGSEEGVEDGSEQRRSRRRRRDREEYEEEQSRQHGAVRQVLAEASAAAAAAAAAAVAASEASVTGGHMTLSITGSGGGGREVSTPTQPESRRVSWMDPADGGVSGGSAGVAGAGGSTPTGSTAAVPGSRRVSWMDSADGGGGAGSAGGGVTPTRPSASSSAASPALESTEVVAAASPQPTSSIGDRGNSGGGGGTAAAAAPAVNWFPPQRIMLIIPLSSPQRLRTPRKERAARSPRSAGMDESASVVSGGGGTSGAGSRQSTPPRTHSRHLSYDSSDMPYIDETPNSKNAEESAAAEVAAPSPQSSRLFQRVSSEVQPARRPSQTTAKQLPPPPKDEDASATVTVVPSPPSLSFPSAAVMAAASEPLFSGSTWAAPRKERPPTQEPAPPPAAASTPTSAAPAATMAGTAAAAEGQARPPEPPIGGVVPYPEAIPLSPTAAWLMGVPTLPETAAGEGGEKGGSGSAAAAAAEGSAAKADTAASSDIELGGTWAVRVSALGAAGSASGGGGVSRGPSSTHSKSQDNISTPGSAPTSEYLSAGESTAPSTYVSFPVSRTSLGEPSAYLSFPVSRTSLADAADVSATDADNDASGSQNMFFTSPNLAAADPFQMSYSSRRTASVTSIALPPAPDLGVVESVGVVATAATTSGGGAGGSTSGGGAGGGGRPSAPSPSRLARVSNASDAIPEVPSTSVATVEVAPIPVAPAVRPVPGIYARSGSSGGSGGDAGGNGRGSGGGATSSISPARLRAAAPSISPPRPPGLPLRASQQQPSATPAPARSPRNAADMPQKPGSGEGGSSRGSGGGASSQSHGGRRTNGSYSRADAAYMGAVEDLVGQVGGDHKAVFKSLRQRFAHTADGSSAGAGGSGGNAPGGNGGSKYRGAGRSTDSGGIGAGGVATTGTEQGIHAREVAGAASTGAGTASANGSGRGASGASPDALKPRDVSSGSISSVRVSGEIRPASWGPSPQRSSTSFRTAQVTTVSWSGPRKRPDSAGSVSGGEGSGNDGSGS